MKDIDDLRRRINSLVRAAQHISAHAADLHGLAWDAPSGDGEPDRGAYESRTPRAGNPRARRLYERITAEVSTIEAELVGLRRQMDGLFFAGSDNPEPSRGSMIRRDDFDQQLTKQRGRDDTPTKLVPQPQHPGAKQ